MMMILDKDLYYVSLEVLGAIIEPSDYRKGKGEGTFTVSLTLTKDLLEKLVTTCLILIDTKDMPIEQV